MVPRLPPSVDGSTPGGVDDGYSSRNGNVACGVVSAASEYDDDDAGSRFGAAELKLGVSKSAVFGSREPAGEGERHQEGRWESHSSDRRSGYGNPDTSKHTVGGTAMRNDREDPHQQHHHQRRSPLAFNTTNSEHHPHHHHSNHHHQQHLKAPGGGNNGPVTPSRVSTERLSLDGFDGSPSSGAAAAPSGGVNSSSSGNRNNALPTPVGGGTPGRSSVGSAGLKARGPGRASPSVNSPRSLSPGRRGLGGDVGGIVGGGVGSSPKKQGRRPTDSQGGVSHNFKVRSFRRRGRGVGRSNCAATKLIIIGAVLTCLLKFERVCNAVATCYRWSVSAFLGWTASTFVATES